MKQNTGVADRVIRLIAGIILFDVLISHSFSPYLTIAALAAGVLLLLTAAIGFCPLYEYFGVTTVSRRKSNQN